jgi:XTP/dITP diphosphohydrolase
VSHKLLLATRNQGKIIEFRRILEELAPGDIDLLGLEEFPTLHDVVESGSTFAENALLKAREMSEATGLPAIADDSGLCIDALDGAPGIYSARWAGEHGNDEANVAKVLEELGDIPDGLRGAHFVCVATLYLPDGRSITEEGRFYGSILRSPIGDNGFGYDPIFAPDGLDISSAQMSAAAKDEASHRGQALRAIAPRILEALTSLK